VPRPRDEMSLGLNINGMRNARIFFGGTGWGNSPPVVRHRAIRILSQLGAIGHPELVGAMAARLIMSCVCISACGALKCLDKCLESLLALECIKTRCPRSSLTHPCQQGTFSALRNGLRVYWAGGITG
jgi:hypothetical protein